MLRAMSNIIMGGWRWLLLVVVPVSVLIGLQIVHAQGLCGTTEVVVVGGGFAGLGAAKEMKDNNFNEYMILESTNRVGGRVQSTQPPGFDGVWVEDGANWLLYFDGNPLIDLLDKYGKTYTLNNYYDYKIFEYDPTDKTKSATRLNMDYRNQRLVDLTLAYKCVQRNAKRQINPDKGPPITDNGVLALLASPECKWIAETNVDFAMQWIEQDYENTQRDTSIASFPYQSPDTYFITDQDGGYESVARNFVADEGIPIQFGKKVVGINYDYVDPANPNYKVKIDVMSSDSSCNHYLANFVILTVPTGVLEQNKIAFSPPLLSPVGPMTHGLYIRIFYKFNFRVGPKYKNEFLYAIVEGPGKAENNDRCINWQNMDAKRNYQGNGTGTTFIPGENIWMCTLNTEGFTKYLAEGDGQSLSADQIDNLLDPLRRIFPERPITKADYAYYYQDLNRRESYGNGAYGNWKIGFNLGDYYKYYGGGPIGPCQHNGCDSNDVWRLHISGTASCFLEWEFVHGAYFAGQRSAKYVLAEMGLPVDTNFKKCENFRSNFVLPSPRA